MSLKILAVDDSQTLRDMIRITLTNAGMTVVTANDGIHGLELLEKMQPDAIISDLNMPRMDGFEFITSVRNIDRFRVTPILMLTTESGPELKARARNSGATGWIVKPFDPNKLIGSIQMITG